MADRITTIVVTLIGLCVLAVFIGAIALTALAATGDVGEPNGCRDQTNASADVRGVNRDSSLSDAWQTRWLAFDRQLDSGQSASVSFTESESSSRAARYLDSKDAPIDDLVICFHDGSAEASAKVDLPILGDIPGIGGVFESNVLVKGTIDFSGTRPKITITEIEAGNLPSDAADQLKGSIEDLVNDRIDDLKLEHKHTATFTEGSIQISGTP